MEGTLGASLGAIWAPPAPGAAGSGSPAGFGGSRLENRPREAERVWGKPPIFLSAPQEPRRNWVTPCLPLLLCPGRGFGAGSVGFGAFPANSSLALSPLVCQYPTPNPLCPTFLPPGFPGIPWAVLGPGNAGMELNPFWGFLGSLSPADNPESHLPTPGFPENSLSEDCAGLGPGKLRHGRKSGLNPIRTPGKQNPDGAK